MKKSLRILNVEDSERDSALLTRHMEAAGYDLFLKRVETAESLKAALVEAEWDVILCDYSMPRFSALAALTVLRASKIDVPFIIISGTVGEEIAVKALLSGANDYIPKGNLTRLIPAIQRELQQADHRSAKRKAEEALKASEAELRALFAAMSDVILVFDHEGRHLKVAPTNPKHFYRRGTNRIGKTVHEIYPKDVADLLLANIQTCLDESRTLNVEYHLDVDGNDMWFAGTVTPMTENSVVWVARDITQRKRGEDELRESEEKFAGAFELAPIGVALVLPDGRWLKVNRALCELLGYSEAELLELDFQGITHRDDLEEDLRNSSQLLAGEISHYQMEKRYIHRQGHIVFVHLHVSLVRHENGAPRYFISQIQDITGRKADEHQLQLHSLILNSIGQSVIVTDSAGTITYWNNLAEKIFGWNSSEVLGKNIIEVTPTTATRAQGVDILETLQRGESWSGEFTVQDRSGKSFPAFVTNTPLLNAEGKVDSIVGISLDVTERKKDEEKLRESESLLAASQRITHLGSWIMDISESGAVVENSERWSDEHYRIFGLEPGEIEITDEVFYNSVHPEDRESLATMIRETIENQKPYDLEHRIILPDGTERIVHAMAEAVLDAKTGKVIKLLGTVQDITESKLATVALAESEERYRDLVENAIDVIYTLDLNGNYTSMNKAGELLSGYAHDVSMTRNIADSLLPEYREKALQMISAQIHGQNISAFEIEIESRDGRRIALEVNTRAIKNNGITVGVQGIARDVTERKRADAELQEKSALLEAQLNSTIDGILIVDEHGKQIIQNRQIVDIFKIPPNIAADPDDSQQVRWVTNLMKDPDEFLEKVLYLYANPDVISRDEIELKDGTTLDRYSSPVFGRDNKNYGRIWTFRDITARKLAEVALRESELRLRAIIDTEPECVKLLARDGSILEMNAAGLKMIEADSFEQIANSNVAGLVAEQDRRAFRDLIENVFCGASVVLDFQINGLKGSRRWLDTHASPLRDASGNITALVGITRDITKQKRSEKERRIIFEIIQGAIRSHGLDEFLELVHRSIAKMVYAENFLVTLHDPVTDHFINQFWADKFDPPPLPQPVGMGFGSYVLRTAEPLMVTSEIKAEMVAKGDAVLSGTPSASWVGVPLRTPTRTIGIMVLQHYEIENAYDQLDLEFLSSVGDQVALAIERQWAQTLLIESKEQLKLAAESVNLGIWDWDVVENKLEWDSRMYELYGIRAEDYTGAFEAWQKGLHPEDRKSGEENVKAALADERPFNNEFRVVWPNGEIHNIEARALVKRDSKGSPLRMIGVNWDITGRKTLEEQYRQSQKMEAVGVLAGGIAHDFNNLLTAINGFSDLTLRRMTIDSPFRSNIQEVKNAGTRAAELTSQLLAFSRKQVLNPSVINLNSVISSIEEMLRRIIRESVELRVVLAPQLGNVMADNGQVEQVIMNLAINARDAMPDGGNLTIETDNVSLGNEYVNQHIMVAPGEFVRITVSDTGEGMDPTTQSHIFEPFFTTKEVGKGTGLGLATVYGIVKQSGGTIMVYSELGHGTTFKIYFPCVDIAVEKPRWLGEEEASFVGTETILLVEDEDAVRSFVTEVLESSGYTVLGSSNGPDALALCQNYEKPIHLLLTDVIMPKMSGSELKKRIVEMLPEIKVLFISGYTDVSIADRGIDDRNIAFLEKPFSPDRLIHKVRDVLELPHKSAPAL